MYFRTLDSGNSDDIYSKGLSVLIDPLLRKMLVVFDINAERVTCNHASEIFLSAG